MSLDQSPPLPITIPITIIVACSRTGVIGHKGAIPWHLPADLKRFRQLTWGKPLLMGRRTFESIGRPLPGRLNIVITRHQQYRPAGVVIADSPDQAIKIARNETSDEAMIIGGSEIYRHFLPVCSTIHLTLVEGDFEGDTFFPIDQIQPPDWILLQQERPPDEPFQPIAWEYQILTRSGQTPLSFEYS